MNTVNKTEHKLADGRDIIYFDDATTELPAERLLDQRATSIRPAVAEMRLDSLTGDWISVAAARQSRAFLPPAHECPLCPSTDAYQSEIPDQFDVVVFENKSPSFGPELLASDDPGYTLSPKLELGSIRKSVGRCEVVVFSSGHNESLASLPISRVRTLIDVWADRTESLQKLPGVREVFPFENRGEEIGVTLHHPHGQIYAYPFITPRTKKLLSSLESFGEDLFEKTLAFELASSRVLIAGKFFTAYVPFSARWPLEIHLLPNRKVNHFGQLATEERDELASIYSRLIGALDKVYDTPSPYISAWHQAPLVPGGENVWMQLQITSPRRGPDKLKFLAGSEAAMGAFVADMAPEVSAEMLKRALI